MYAKLVPAKERMQVVARSYFKDLSVLLRPTILVHSAVFAACARAIFLTVNISLFSSDDSKSDWKKLKDQLCDCGDANVASFLTNLRRSNAVMQLSLASLALLRPLRAAFISNTLSCQCNHSRYATFPTHRCSFSGCRVPQPTFRSDQAQTRQRFRGLGFLCRRL